MTETARPSAHSRRAHFGRPDIEPNKARHTNTVGHSTVPDIDSIWIQPVLGLELRVTSVAIRRIGGTNDAYAIIRGEYVASPADEIRLSLPEFHEQFKPVERPR